MTQDQEIQALNKIVNSGLILSTYPEVDHIDVSLGGVRQPYLIYKVHMKYDDTDEKDIYDDIDPHWLIDHHVRNTISKLIPFEHIPINANDYQVIIYDSEGNSIYDWESILSLMKPGSTGRTDWERRSNRE
jgi:hypothetical protein